MSLLVALLTLFRHDTGGKAGDSVMYFRYVAWLDIVFTVVIRVASSFQALEQCANENFGTGNGLSDLVRADFS